MVRRSAGPIEGRQQAPLMAQTIPGATMTEAVPTFPNGDMSNADFLARAPELRAWSLRVAEVIDASPRMRQLRLTSPDLAELSYAPGQDLMVLVDTSGGRLIRRRYTIRS